MEALITRLNTLVDDGATYITSCGDDELTSRPKENKWSRKEILGHLIDSAVNNLRRFTEIRFMDKPYKVTSYRQAELVRANDYQHADVHHLLRAWTAINDQIAYVIGTFSPEELRYEVIIGDDTHEDLEFLVIDYVDHLEHHMRQIFEVRST